MYFLYMFLSIYEQRTLDLKMRPMPLVRKGFLKVTPPAFVCLFQCKLWTMRLDVVEEHFSTQ